MGRFSQECKNVYPGTFFTEGLNNANNQKAAEQLRDSSESIISMQDKTGNDLREAKAIAQKYYDAYVPYSKSK